MKNLISILLVLVLTVIAITLLPKPEARSGAAQSTAGSVTAITHVRLFDGDQVMESATLLMADRPGPFEFSIERARLH